jgi:glycosidase
MIYYNGWKLQLTTTNAIDTADRHELNVKDSILLWKEHPTSNFYSKLYRVSKEQSANFVGTLRDFELKKNPTPKVITVKVR